jgi:uncharacterized protein (UPF0332 family)
VSEARSLAHVAKAREFLDAAELNHDAGLPNSAVSNAVTAGINAKDAICLRTLGSTGKTDRHADAIKELMSTGEQGRQLAPTLKRLLALKTPSQYAADTVTPAQAQKAVHWARRLVEVAEVTVV